MKRSILNPVGKIGKINIEARKSIASQCEEMGLERCELRFPFCNGTFGLAPAHKHPREWYRGRGELLSDWHHWIVACQYCHEILDDRSKTSKKESDEIFDTLRT